MWTNLFDSQNETAQIIHSKYFFFGLRRNHAKKKLWNIQISIMQIECANYGGMKSWIKWAKKKTSNQKIYELRISQEQQGNIAKNM